MGECGGAHLLAHELGELGADLRLAGEEQPLEPAPPPQGPPVPRRGMYILPEPFTHSHTVESADWVSGYRQGWVRAGCVCLQ